MTRKVLVDYSSLTSGSVKRSRGWSRQKVHDQTFRAPATTEHRDLARNVLFGCCLEFK
jgi:hypothetical protein